MKAKLLALASLASLLFLSGCNGIGDKDTLLARIDDEKVYQEDYDLLLKNPRLPDTVKNVQGGCAIIKSQGPSCVCVRPSIVWNVQLPFRSGRQSPLMCHSG
jgi:hypothetical protein